MSQLDARHVEVGSEVDHEPAERRSRSARVRVFVSGRWWRSNGLQLALLAAPVVLFAYVVWEHRYSIEDGFIYYRIADNLSFGYGPVFNPGERVEAYTSVAWLGLLGLVRSTIGGLMGPGSQAAVLGTVCSTSALALGTYGSWRLQSVCISPTSERSWYLPAGAFVLLGAPAIWYFGTSGLETSLCFAWAAGSFAILATRATMTIGSARDGRAARVDRPRSALVVLGLGWLMRPEMVLYSLGFCAVWFLLSPGDVRGRLRAVGWMTVIPVAYQVFRMGYFATMLPNTAIAKSAARSNWSDGWAYWQDFVAYDRLLLPIWLVVAATVWTAVRAFRQGRSRLLAVALVAPIVGALHAIYVIRIGGDFQHARFLVIPFFTFVLPVTVLPLQWSPARWRVVRVVPLTIGLAVTLIWVAGTGAKWGMLRTEPVYTTLRFGMFSGDKTPNPTDVEDFGGDFDEVAQAAVAARSAAARGDDVLINSIPVDYGSGTADVIALQPGYGTALITCCIGIKSVYVGPDVWVVDQYSLADPLGARLELDESNPFYDPAVGNPQPMAWILARFPPAEGDPDAGVTAARRALTCGQLGELMQAVDGAMTPGQFLTNLVNAPSFTSMRIPIDPIEAEAAFCGDGGDEPG